jgi:hypothetical protein
MNEGPAMNRSRDLQPDCGSDFTYGTCTDPVVADAQLSACSISVIAY